MRIKGTKNQRANNKPLKVWEPGNRGAGVWEPAGGLAGDPKRSGGKTASTNMKPKPSNAKVAVSMLGPRLSS